MNVEEFDDILSLVKKKSLNTCILSYVTEAFNIIWFFLKLYMMQMFYSWIVISAETLWAPVSFSVAEYAMIWLFLV